MLLAFLIICNYYKKEDVFLKEYIQQPVMFVKATENIIGKIHNYRKHYSLLLMTMKGVSTTSLL